MVGGGASLDWKGISDIVVDGLGLCCLRDQFSAGRDGCTEFPDRGIFGTRREIVTSSTRKTPWPCSDCHAEGPKDNHDDVISTAWNWSVKVALSA